MIYIPLWLKLSQLYLWNRKHCMEAKLLFLCCSSRSKCQKERSAFLLSCTKRKENKQKNNFPKLHKQKKQKGESIALSLGYYTALQGVGSYWKSFTVYILLYWLVTQKKSTANDLICMAMKTLCDCSCHVFFSVVKKKEIKKRENMFDSIRNPIMKIRKELWTCGKVT